MKIILLSGCLIAVGLGNILAQGNLVPNPSFEVFSSCPVSSGEIFKAPPWSIPNQSTPDYFNQCNGAALSVPGNFVGYQLAYEGVAYAGVATYWAAWPQIREYIQAPLLQPLVSGKIYCVLFYVSITSGEYVTDDIGALFTANPVSGVNNEPMIYNAQVNSTQGVFLSDSSGWTRISGSFVAAGGESYITIGSFKSNSNVDTAYWSGLGATYYYVDSVTVIECGDTNVDDFFIPTAFSPNDDNNNDALHVRGPIGEMDLYIYDRWGEEVYHGTDPQQGWDGTYKGKALDAGVFVYYFRGVLENGEEVTMKGNITLVR